jgi:NAD(P)H-dependent nitrite reductase small subunit
MSTWIKIGAIADMPVDSGVNFKHEDKQIAIFNFGHTEWYATQNLCPHKQQMVLSRGLLGDSKGELKITCPLHKYSFSLKSGQCLADDQEWCLATYPVKVEGSDVFIEI